MRLKYQLFLVLLLTGSLLVALMATVSSWSFDRGFIAYINDTERQRLEPLIDALAKGYEQHGDWAWLTRDRHAWRVLLDTHLDNRRRRPDRRNDRRSDKGDMQPRSLPTDAARPARPLEERRSLPPPPGNVTEGFALDPRLLFADADRQILIGRKGETGKTHWQAVIVDDESVGFLGYRLRQSLPGGLDQAFATQQRRSFIHAALAMVLLSALFAVTLAGRLARPLLAVNDAVARIGRGQYAHRLPDSRSDELGDLSRSINTLAETLEKNLDARRQWLAEISHELRTPVAVLQGELEAIQDGVKPQDDHAIDSLHAETLRLARLIDDLHDLTLSDVGALDYHFERLDLDATLRERIDRARNLPESAAISISVTPSSSPVFIAGDQQRLGQLIDNLFQNSIRYTDPGGELCIALSVVRDKAVVEWADSSPGVGDEQLARLFDPLYRADRSRNRASGGAGLGLAIARRIVEAHKGTLTATHSSLGGIAYRIEIPLLRGGTA